jgi:hypothetical protein
MLVLEKGIVKNAVVDVNFSHLWLHPLPHLLFQGLRLIVGLLSHLADSGVLNKIGQLERNLVDATLVLEVLPLLYPVLRHRHGVSETLEEHQIHRV